MNQNFVIILLLSLLLGLLGCSAQDNDAVGAKGDSELNQGAGGDDDEGDLDVAEPVPMWLVSGDDTLKLQVDNLDNSGAKAGGYDQVETDISSSPINPMNTSSVWPSHEKYGDNFTCSDDDKAAYNYFTNPTLEADANVTDNIPINFGISLGKVSTAGYAAAELRKLLNIQAQLINATLVPMFGTEKGKDHKTKNSVTRYPIGEGAGADGEIKWIELVVVVPKNDKLGLMGIYRVNFYTKAGNEFALSTQIEFSPKKNNPQFAQIALFHAYQAPGAAYADHLSMSYDTETKRVNARFGTKPSLLTRPAETEIELIIGDVYYMVLGEFLHTNENSASTSTLAAPQYYSPANGDRESFRMITELTSGLSVQNLSYTPAAVTRTVDEDRFTPENSYYTAQLTNYIVNLVRDDGVNPGCATDTVPALQTACTGDCDLGTVPSNICASNTAVSNATVQTMLETACQHIAINMCLNVSIAGVVQNTYVGLCRKLVEAQILKNQYIEVADPYETGTKSRFLEWAYASDTQLFKELYNSTEPPGKGSSDAAILAKYETYVALEAALKLEPFPSFELGAHEWPEIETKNAAYFGDGDDDSGTGLVPFSLTGG